MLKVIALNSYTYTDTHTQSDTSTGTLDTHTDSSVTKIRYNSTFIKCLCPVVLWQVSLLSLLFPLISLSLSLPSILKAQLQLT